MAISIYFPIQAMTSEKYDEAMRRLEAAGQSAPQGRLYHTSFGASQSLQVFDVWDSHENFEAFGQVLMPILAELGIKVDQPHVEEVHNIATGG